MFICAWPIPRCPTIPAPTWECSLRGCEIRDEGAIVFQRCVAVNPHLAASIQFIEYVRGIPPSSSVLADHLSCYYLQYPPLSTSSKRVD